MGLSARKSLGIEGKSEKDILQELKLAAVNDPDFRSGKTWSLVYYMNEEYEQFIQSAYASYASLNGLNPLAFQSLKKLENDIIDMTLSLHKGPPEACGVVTSGGTESCLLAVKTYRDFAIKEKGIKKPEMILPVTAHVAWEKGADYFGVRIRRAPLRDDFTVDANAVERLVNKRTVLLVGSAPEYPHGMIDPIEELGEIALRHDLPLHVDACVGGFLLPFMELNGEEVPLWDYRVPGVTSISADVHKYAFAAKGASTITYRNMDLLSYQMFISENWPGGLFASPALLGTRPGGAYAAAWAALQYFGVDGYKHIARDVSEVLRGLCIGIQEIEGLEVIGQPASGILAYRSIDKQVNIYAVGDVMEARGWHIDRIQFPSALHAMITPRHKMVFPQYLEDLKEAVQEVRKHPEFARQGSASLYGMAATVPIRSLVRKQIKKTYMEMFAPGAGLPDSHNQH